LIQALKNQGKVIACVGLGLNDLLYTNQRFLKVVDVHTKNIRLTPVRRPDVSFVR